MYRKNIPKILGLLLLLALLGCSRSFVLEPVREGQQSDSGVLSDGKRFSEEARPEKIREAKPEQKPYKHFKHKAWAVLAGNPKHGSDEGSSIVVDKAGNSYVMGNTVDGSKLGRFTKAEGAYWFLAKLDRNGKFVWVLTSDGGYGGGTLSLDQKGFLYLTGSGPFPKKGKFGDWEFSFREESEDRGFVAKLDREGHVLWFRSYKNADYWTRHVVDRRGNVYIAGKFWVETKLGKTVLKEKGYFFKSCKKSSDCPYERGCMNEYMNPKEKKGYCSPNSDILLAKLSPKGEYLWVKQYGGFYDDIVNGLAIDKDDKLYMTGKVGGHWEDPDPKEEEKKKIKIGKYNVSRGSFLAKFDQKGEAIWVRSMGRMYFGSLVTDYKKNMYGWAERFEKDKGQMVLFKMGEDGKFIWEREIETLPGALALDKKGNVYMTGPFDRRAVFGKHVIYTYGSKRCQSTKGCGKEQSCVKGKCMKKECIPKLNSCTDNSIFVTKVSPSGKFLWAFSFGSTWSDWGYGIALDQKGNIFVTGVFGGKGGAIGDFDFTSASDKEAVNQIFIAKFLAR